MITVRAARPGDGEALHAMVAALAHSHGHGEGFKARPEDFELALFREHPVIGALIAETAGQPAGCAIWNRSYSTFRGEEVMYLQDLSVLPDFRRRGVARALLKAIARLAVEKSFAAVYWLMMDWNEAGRALYESVGAEIEGGNCFCSLNGPALHRLAQ
jgi:GNAT superfamily N-acetyltransferase